MILKIFYAVTAVLSLVNGLWMLFFPLAWYTDLPAGVPHTGPFNAHFVRDIGVAFIVAAIGLAWCARRPEQAYPIHIGLTIFFTGHALIHIADILSGRLPDSHWLIDAPSVFLPAVLLIALAIPPARRRLGGM
jgi:hypothetical protein